MPPKNKMTPYSILANDKAKEEWDAQKTNLETLMGSKTTRAHIMKQIHLKNQFHDTLVAGRIQKILNAQEIEANRAVAQIPKNKKY